MHDRPTPLELLEAVAEFVEGELLPLMDDHRMKFRTLVALNALGIALRELADPGEQTLSRDEAAELVRRIRADGADPELLPLLKREVAAKLRVSNPRYRGGTNEP
ncbi:MAG: DUF6285 domain-containing protein [Gaiellaceae bacterium]